MKNCSEFVKIKCGVVDIECQFHQIGSRKRSVFEKDFEEYGTQTGAFQTVPSL